MSVRIGAGWCPVCKGYGTAHCHEAAEFMTGSYRFDRIETENRRLRAALDEIARIGPVGNSGDKCARLAIAALTLTEGSGS